MGKNKKNPQNADAGLSGPQKQLTKAQKKAEKAERERMRKSEIAKKVTGLNVANDNDAPCPPPLRTFAEIIKQSMMATLKYNENIKLEEQSNCSHKQPTMIGSKLDTSLEPAKEALSVSPPLCSTPWNDGRLYSDVVSGAAKARPVSPEKASTNSIKKITSATCLPLTLKIRTSKSDISLFPALTETRTGLSSDGKSASDTKVCVTAADNATANKPDATANVASHYSNEDQLAAETVDFTGNIKNMPSKNAGNASPLPVDQFPVVPSVIPVDPFDMHFGSVQGTEVPDYNTQSSSRPASSSKPLSFASPEFVSRVETAPEDHKKTGKYPMDAYEGHNKGQSVHAASSDKDILARQDEKKRSDLPLGMIVHAWNFLDLDTDLGPYPKFQHQFVDENYLNVEMKASTALLNALRMKDKEQSAMDKKQHKRMNLFGQIDTDETD